VDSALDVAEHLVAGLVEPARARRTIEALPVEVFQEAVQGRRVLAGRAVDDVPASAYDIDSALEDGSRRPRLFPFVGHGHQGGSAEWTVPNLANRG
jgi:hypothetical protein